MTDQALQFKVWDYLSLGVILSVSVVIGIYTSIARKRNTIEEYLFGSRKLQIVPVSLSIMATLISSVTIITVPTEIYYYGSDFNYFIFSHLIGFTSTYFLFLPFFQGLKISTMFEYLNRRFDGTVRTVCSALFTLAVLLNLPIVMSVCSMTLSQASGINFYASTIIFGTVTTFYTTIGGIKAVVWSDVLQALFMFIGVIALAIKGTMNAGGFYMVWSKNYDFGRITPPTFALNFTELYNVWAWILGDSLGYIVRLYFNQGVLQRFLSLPSLEDAKRCVIITAAFSFSYFAIIIYLGMLLVTTFIECDPLQNHEVTRKDQILSLYVMKTLKNSSGVPGLLIAAIVSAALSTISTHLNSIAAVVLFDYFKPYVNRNISESTSAVILKVTVFLTGIITTVLACFIHKLGSALQVTFGVLGAITGPIIAIVIIGMFIPTIKSKATFLGCLAGFSVTSGILLKMNAAVASGDFRYRTKEIFTTKCENNFTSPNVTKSNRMQRLQQICSTPGIFAWDMLTIILYLRGKLSYVPFPQCEAFRLYQISNLWYPSIGFLITVLTANILNLFMERNDPSKMDRTLFSPLIHRFYPIRTDDNSPEYQLSLLSSVKQNDNTI